MSARDLPSDVRTLLRKRLRGLEHVELLLFLRRCAPQAWSASRLATQLSWPAKVADALEALCEAELLVAHDAGSERVFAYGPTTQALDAAVAALDEIYAEHRTIVIRELNEHALERLRSDVPRCSTGETKTTYPRHCTRRRCRPPAGLVDPGPITLRSHMG